MSVDYYKLEANRIYDDINGNILNPINVDIEGIKLTIFPHVYPSHKFRTTSFVLKNLKELVKGKKICDMGCGPGIVGLFALYNGASHVIQADINPEAVKNAKQNNFLNKFKESQIQTYLSNCFDNIPKTTFDLIIFNMPYHNDEIEIDDPLKYAFYDPGFINIKKFLQQAKEYSHENTQITIAFSSKGKFKILEQIFTQNNYDWELWRITNADQEFDNRIYLLKKRKIN